MNGGSEEEETLTVRWLQLFHVDILKMNRNVPFVLMLRIYCPLGTQETFGVKQYLRGDSLRNRHK